VTSEQSRSRAWRAATESLSEEPARFITDLMGLAENDEAARILGVDGALDGQLDAAFLADPMDWIAYDIATALYEAENETLDAPAAMNLTVLVAELRLYRALRGSIDDMALARRAREHLAELRA
jgi:hypothetical protein